MSQRLSILFCGTSEFAVPSLQALARDPAFSIIAVVTQPDRPVGRTQALTAPPVKVAAQKLGLTVLQPESLNDDAAVLKLPRPDFLIAISYGQIFSQRVLDIPSVAPINVHGSLLPRFRGASPIHHTILAGDTVSGVSIQRMVKELDAGPVVAQQSLATEPRETMQTLHDKLKMMAAPLLIDVLKKPLKERPQDTAKVTVCGKLKREDGIVNPQTMTAEEIDRKVRALHPWPGVSWGEVKLLATQLEPSKDSFPLECAGGTVLYITKIQPAGKKAMTGVEFGRGRTKR